MAQSSSNFPNFLLLAEAANQSISDIAEKLGKDEYWVSRVLTGLQTCDPKEAAEIARLLRVDSKYACHLVNKPKIKSSKLGEYLEKFIDKVVLGGVALVVALVLQYQFSGFSIDRERAMAVSNLRSEFLLDLYSQAKEDFAKLLVKLESAEQAMLNDINSLQSMAAPDQIRIITTRFEVDVGVIASAHPSTHTSANAAIEAMTQASMGLIERSPPNDFEQRIENFKTTFLAFSDACQKALVETVEIELEMVQKRRSLWRNE